MTRETLISLYSINHQALRANAKDVTDDEALLQPKPAGHCRNWVVGHVVASRNGMMQLVGAGPFWDPALNDRYKRGSAPIQGPGEGKPLRGLLADLDLSQERLLGWLTTAPETTWDSPLEDWGTVGKALYFFQFHEAYHVGQAGLLRRLAGKKGAIA
jgi:hypothetical protein